MDKNRLTTITLGDTYREIRINISKSPVPIPSNFLVNNIINPKTNNGMIILNNILVIFLDIKISIIANNIPPIIPTKDTEKNTY